MTLEGRPDPDYLLKVVQKETAQNLKGRLRIFFGMAAGVGKTYSMLKAAQERWQERVDVVIGVVETHHRVETEALLQGLPVILKRTIDYRGTWLEEMDLDAILARKPQLVLVDELAHSNIPGSRHPKRWQDVMELLDAGIDVYTTINVQHLESRKEAVEGITGILIRETVPDSILDRAVQIDLIDLSPRDLLKRLREGKVYLGENAQVAQEHFFKEDRLTALREIALRLTAERVDLELRDMTPLQERRTAWNTNERLLTAVSPSPHSETNIRATRRLAFTLGAPWVAAYIETRSTLNEKDRITLEKNLELARELGAEVITVTDSDVVSALQKLTRQKNVTHIVMGRPEKHWWRDLIDRGNILDHLVRQNSEVDIHVIRLEKETKTSHPKDVRPHFQSPLAHYGYVIALVIAVILISEILLPWIGYRAVGFLFLLVVLLLGLFMSRGPIYFAALLSALLWDFLFIPPPGTFTISQPEDIAMIIVYFLVAIIAGTLTNRIRSRERLVRREDERLHMMYEIVRAIADAGQRSDYLDNICTRLGEYLGGRCTIYLTTPEGSLSPAVNLISDIHENEKEQAVARWVQNNRKPAGWSTDTLASSQALYIPIIGRSATLGVFLFLPEDLKHRLLPDERNIVQATVQQLGISLDREKQ
ncbi:MAG: DUF4118 domain-containing protein [bacterium]|nr:DUF4118 domain-containing protein [bacterium]